MEAMPMEKPLDHSQGMALVRLARKTLAGSLHIPWDEEEEPLLAEPIFGREQATFVTLTQRGQLRGCIGTLQPVSPLAESVRDNTFSAAFNDPRFAPVTQGEFDELHIEVSLLTSATPMDAKSPTEILMDLRVGLDGVILKKGGASSTFLPQVWTQLPNPEEFLSQLSLKAGLSKDAWKSPEAKLFTYQVQVFEEI